MKNIITSTNKKISDRMKSVSTRNTYIEKEVRTILHKLGYRYRLHDKDLPGKPDIVLRKYNTVIFVHGCFWHGHNKCKKGRLIPRTNVNFWTDKIERNRARDKKNYDLLVAMGWRVIVIWECQVSQTGEIINEFLDDWHG